MEKLPAGGAALFGVAQLIEEVSSVACTGALTYDLQCCMLHIGALVAVYMTSNLMLSRQAQLGTILFYVSLSTLCTDLSAGEGRRSQRDSGRCVFKYSSRWPNAQRRNGFSA